MVTAAVDPAAMLAATLRRDRLLAIIRGGDPDEMARAIDVIVSAGISLIEVSLTTTSALAVIRRATAEHGEAAMIGAGTVRTPADAAAAREAGAAFLVTPGVAADAVSSSPLPAIVGALTPTEVIAATALGAIAVKLFPASLGGPSYLDALRQPFPDVPFVPVGGIHAGTARAYLERGAVAVGVGGPLVGDGTNPRALAERARVFRAAVAEAAP